MNIAHVPFCYYPDPVGGTEVYVHGLAQAQRSAGHTVTIIAPAARAASYEHDGITVHRYRVDDEVDDLSELYAGDRSIDIAGFNGIIHDVAPDILHVHGYGRAVSESVLREVRRRGIPVVFTYHTPTATCARGTLMRWGHTVCDGNLNAARCAACSLNARGVPRAAAEVAVRLPRVAGRVFKRGKLGTGLRMRDLVELRHAGIRNFLKHADRVIAPSDWVAKLLNTLGVPEQKIVRNRQGTPVPVATDRPPRRPGPLRLAFFGRVERSKGLHVLIDALAAAPELQIELHVFGILQSVDAYARDLKQRAAADPRIRFMSAVPQDEVLRTLWNFDAAVVPSQWLETGPLTVLEAFAAGIPVIGSRLGGISELVRDGVDGILVTPGATAEWTAVLRRVATELDLLPNLRAGVLPPRTTDMVAQEMEQVYRDVLHG